MPQSHSFQYLTSAPVPESTPHTTNTSWTKSVFRASFHTMIFDFWKCRNALFVAENPGCTRHILRWNCTGPIVVQPSPPLGPQWGHIEFPFPHRLYNLLLPPTSLLCAIPRTAYFAIFGSLLLSSKESPERPIFEDIVARPELLRNYKVFRS